MSAAVAESSCRANMSRPIPRATRAPIRSGTQRGNDGIGDRALRVEVIAAAGSSTRRRAAPPPYLSVLPVSPESPLVSFFLLLFFLLFLLPPEPAAPVSPAWAIVHDAGT